MEWRPIVWRRFEPPTCGTNPADGGPADRPMTHGRAQHLEVDSRLCDHRPRAIARLDLREVSHVADTTPDDQGPDGPIRSSFPCLICAHRGDDRPRRSPADQRDAPRSSLPILSSSRSPRSRTTTDPSDSVKRTTRSWSGSTASISNMVRHASPEASSALAANGDRVSLTGEDSVDLQLAAKRLDVLTQG